MGTTKRRRLIGLLVAVGVVLLGAVPAQAQAQKPSADAKPLDSVTKLTVALLPNVNAAALYLAQAKGYFKAEKLDVNIINGGSLVDSLPLLTTGRVDATYAGASAGFFNQVANGVEVQYVAGAGQSRKGGAASAFIVKTGGPIKTLSDLRGKKVTAPGLTGGISAYYLSELLKQANMTVEDVQLVNTDVPGGLAALKNGAVSAALSSGPVMTEALSSGAFQIIGDMDKVLSIGNGGGYILGPSLLKKNRRAGVAFVRALLKTTRKELQ
ncbi:MAG: transporter substrate-binding protein, partial [Actinomycetia bacterium]|nr:transporter substrate-binding protein [Actinomycetes bacterium]